MKKVTGIAIAFILGSGMAGMCHAGEYRSYSYNNPLAEQQTQSQFEEPESKLFNPYLGLGVGVFAVGLKINDIAAGNAEQRNPTIGTYVKAGIDINDYFGGEVRIGLTGNPSTTWGAGLPIGNGLITTVSSTVSTKVDNFFSYFAKIQYPTDRIKFYALIGGTTAKYTTALSIAGFNFAGSTTKTGLSYGGGLEVIVSTDVALGLEWVEYWTNVTIDTATGSTLKGSFRGLSATVNMSF